MQKLLVVMALFAILAGSGCGVRERVFGVRATTEGDLPYRARLRRGEDRRDFTVSVRAGAATIDAVRESVRFEGTAYCVQRYGTSDIIWQMAGDDWQALRDGDELIFSGRCQAR